MTKMSEHQFNRRLTDKLQESLGSDLENFEEPTNDHNNEIWLISYSDMMTLLFGLFVMMYTIAMETKGQPDKVLSDIASGRNSISEIQIQLKQKEQDFAKIKEEKSELNNQLISQNEKIVKLTNDINHFKNIAQEFQDQLLEEKNTTDQNTLNNSNILVTKLKSETEILKNKISLNQQTIDTLTNKLNKMNAELISMNTKTIDSKKELENLKNVKKANNENIKTANFMVVILNWLTPLHDIDLRVTNPLGRLFDFQNRTYKDTKAKFVVDSRTGPGVEMWETQEVEPGDYIIEFYFYNTYGNNNPAKLTASVITRKGVYEIPMIELDFKNNRKKSFKLHTDDSGELTILPQL